MPDKYTAMKKKFMREGMGAKAAKTKAAKIYNAQKKPGDPSLHHSSRMHPSAKGGRNRKH